MKKSYSVFFLILFFTIHGFSQEEEKPNPNVEEIIFVFKTHFDNGYTDMSESVVHKYATSMMEEALATLEKSMSMPEEKQFVWTMPSWPVAEILKRCDPEMKPEIEKAIREEWFAFHALPFTFETESCDPEMLVRSMTFASELSKKYDLPLPHDAKLTDVPSHSWFLPTLLSNAGVKILHIGCNAASSSPEVPLIFWWQGPDDSKLLTMYWGKYYGTSLVPPEEWKFKTWLAIIHTNDNLGPPSPDEVEEVLRKAHELAPNARLKIGRISDFYDALIKEKPELPVIRGDMPDTWIHGVMSMPKEVKIKRTIEKDIISFEKLNTLCNIWSGREEDCNSFITPATENILLFDEHTFGIAMSHGHSGYWCFGDEFQNARASGIYKPIEDSWREKGDRIYQAEKVIIPAYDREMKRISAMVNVQGERIIVFNPSPWKRTGIVTIQQKNKVEALRDLRTGEIIPVDNKLNVLRFVAKEVPSMGYCTFVPITNSKKEGALRCDEAENVIENEFFRIRIDPEKGAIISITDKKSGMEMVGKDPDYGFGQYVYERFSKKNTTDFVDKYIKVRFDWALEEFGRPNLDDTPYSRNVGGKANITYSTDRISVKAIMQFSGDSGSPHDYSLSITLYNDLPFVELNWFIEGKPAEPWPEAGWISFPFNIDNPEFKVGRLGAIVDPTKDFVKGSNFDHYFINSGVALLNKQKNGFGVCSPDAPGISFEKPGLWQYSGSFIPQKPNLFINLYNNQWSTNFTEWIEGAWSAKFYLWSIQSYENESALVSPSEEFRSPLKGSMVSAEAGNLPVSQEGIILSRKGTLITTFGKNPFGEGTIFRLWEQSGIAGKCKITLPEGSTFTRAIPCNLRSEKTGDPILLKDNDFEIFLGSYKPVTFLLE